MDELLKELRTYLADTKNRERAADERTKLIVSAIEEGFKLISHTMMDLSNRRR